MTEQPEPTGLTRAMIDAAFEQLMRPQLRADPHVAMLGGRQSGKTSEFQCLVDEAILAGEHVHTWRGGELRCVMGWCD